MTKQRCETRLLCSELVTVSWHDSEGETKQTVAVLEDISPSGACVQTDRPIPSGEEVVVCYENGNLAGKVRYCRADEVGFYVGVQFPPATKWLQSEFVPDHLLDPSKLGKKAAA